MCCTYENIIILIKSVLVCRRNKHGVPRAAIERMLEKYEHRMSVERILTSERPDKAPPTNKTTPTEQGKTKERWEL